jgi:mRNA-degrading endonuclease RelE of RelBE toxin-antitoxin system
MSYEIAYTKDAGKTVEKLKKSGSVRLREKLNRNLYNPTYFFSVRRYTIINVNVLTDKKRAGATLFY